jgi:predicted nucleotidyltransferase
LDFTKVIKEVVGILEAGGIRYALIGGFAMALRGVQRTTMDLDFILMLEDMDRTHAILTEFGYQRVFHSENVSHYLSSGKGWGRIDILHAFRGPTLGMLSRAELLEVSDGIRLRVVHVEDLIGLKIQALVNNPDRTLRDWSDICLLLQAAREERIVLDWELLKDYLCLFHLEGRLPEMRGIYGALE